MTNREVALIWMAHILRHLYSAWPMRVSLKMDQTLTATGVGLKVNQQNNQLWSDLWLWMAEEGLVRIDTNEDGHSLEKRITGAVLTSKGLEALDLSANTSSQEETATDPDL